VERVSTPVPLPPLHAAGDLAVVAVPVTNLWRRPDAVGPLDPTMTGPHPDATAWADGLDRDARLTLDGRLDTQLLLGEPVRVVAERSGWTQVHALWQPSGRAAEGYPGWVVSAHLTPVPDPTDEPGRVAVVVRGAVATLDGSDAHDGSERLPLSFGTVLPLLDPAPADGFVRVGLPPGRTGWLPATAVASLDEAFDPMVVLDRARMFLALPYLWGGLSSAGTDCSGLVHLAYRAHGWMLPRDADDQRHAAVALDSPEPGDLWFFGTEPSFASHVGFVGDDAKLLHAPGTGRGVEEVAMTPDRRATLIAAARARPLG
jgi:cell wall-associated NlpC family hydrolase